MKNNTRSGAALAIAAVSLALAGATPAAAATPAKVHCLGANSCKAKSDCMTPKNSCKGMNACKGQGWIFVEIRKGLRRRRRQGHGLDFKMKRPPRASGGSSPFRTRRRSWIAWRRPPEELDMESLPRLGYGLGLRPVYYDEILSTRPPVDWFEIISENYMIPGGRPLAMLERFRADYPIVMHGVSMSLASTDPLDLDYLKALKTLADRVEPAWVSDHLAWTGVHGRNLHDLLPIPYTREALDHVVERIGRVQDILKRRLVVENASTYVAFTQSEMPEWEFIARMAERADCLLLLDVNNVFVSGFNHGFDINAFIDAVPADRVAQFHMAGHTDNETHLIDTHDQPIREEVWTLYERARRRFGDVSVMIERDDNFPPFSELLGELQRMRDVDAAIAADASRSAA